MMKSAILPVTALMIMSASAACLSRTVMATAPRHLDQRKLLHPPGLNHMYVVLDEATFAAFRDSRAVAALLGRADGGLPAYGKPKRDADRIFFRGRQTYLELFAPNNRFREPVGKVGLGLGHDDPTSFELLQQSWQDTCGKQFKRERIAFERVRPSVPWHDAIWCEVTANQPQMSVWAMVYRPEFASWQSAIGGSDRTGISRASILAGRPFGEQGTFDIAALTMDVPAPLHAKLVDQFLAAGFVRNKTPSGTRLTGHGWSLLLRAGSATPRLGSITLTTYAAPKTPLAVGSAILTRKASYIDIEF